MTIRFATNEEGPAIRALVVESGLMSEGFAHILDWRDLGGSWLVDEAAGKIKGCAQVCYGKPTTRLENLATSAHLDGRARARVIRDLQEAALALCKQLGVSAVRAFVPFSNTTVKKNMKKRGWSVTDQGNVLLRML